MYLYDVVILRFVEEHLDHIWTVIWLASTEDFSLRLKNCSFFEDSFDWLNHIINRAGWVYWRKRLMRLVGYSTLQTWLKSSRFLVSLTYFGKVYRNSHAWRHRWAAECKKPAFPFRRLNETEMEGLETLQNWLMSPAVKALPRPNGRYRFDPDACDTYVGFVIMHGQAKRQAEHVGYWWYLLNKARQA